MNKFLTTDELYLLTCSPQKSRQIAWLKANRIKHRVTLTGHPVVTWRAVDGASGEPVAVPNWEAMRV